MGLEVHVMPISKFYQRDFIPTVERDTGMKVKVIGATVLPEEQAKTLETKITKLAEKYSGTSARLSFEDKVYYSEKLGYQRWHHLRQFAAYQDYPFYKIWPILKHPFERGLGNEPIAAVIKVLESKKTKFPNIVFHDDNKGFYFPIPIRFPIESQWGYIGSVVGLENELNLVTQSIKTSGYWHVEIDEAISMLREAISQSKNSGCPIIYDG